MDDHVDWSRCETHIWERHRLLVRWAIEAIADPGAGGPSESSATLREPAVSWWLSSSVRPADSLPQLPGTPIRRTNDTTRTEGLHDSHT